MGTRRRFGKTDPELGTVAEERVETGYCGAAAEVVAGCGNRAGSDDLFGDWGGDTFCLPGTAGQLLGASAGRACQWRAHVLWSDQQPLQFLSALGLYRGC